VIVAGGIGLAPVRPAVLHALAHRDEYREVCLLVGARTPSDLVFRDELESWVHDPRLFVATTVDRAEPGWDGPVGLVTRLVDRAPFDPDGATIITCGPEIMMRFVARSALARGVFPHRIHVTLERNMRCGVGTCGHCQVGPVFVCRDGPVFPWPDVKWLLEVREW
jgi:anaerobic sulfite reductase subunit B